MIPDYSSTYFPPPGSSNPSAPYFPPPPPRGNSQVSSTTNPNSSPSSALANPDVNTTRFGTAHASSHQPHQPPSHGAIYAYQPHQNHILYSHQHGVPSSSHSQTPLYSSQPQSPLSTQYQAPPQHSSPYPSPGLPQVHLPPAYQLQPKPQSEPSPQFQPAHQLLPSSHQAPPAVFRTAFASLSLHASDRLRLLRFPSTIIPLIRSTILHAWPRGIQAYTSPSSSRPYHEFQMKGNPWGIFSGEMKVLKGAFGDDTGVQMIYARRLMCRVLAALHEEGWVLTVSTDISKVQWDTDTLIFRNQRPAPAACEWFSVAFRAAHKIRFVDAPRSVCLAVVERLGRRKVEVKCKEHEKAEGCYEVKMMGMGWGLVGNEMMKTREMLLDMLECFEEQGWTVYASIDQKVGSEDQGETDTWHVCRLKGWTSGAPVYHN